MIGLATALAAAVVGFAPPAGLQLSGPHVHAGNVGIRLWSEQAAVNVPLPHVRVGVYYGDAATYPGNQVYLPRVGRGGWTWQTVHGLFVHELGHVFDNHDMNPTLRAAFMREAGVPATCTRWWRDCKTVRWVVSDHYYVTLPPGEMFAEEYAACALGLTQREYQDAGFNSYGWIPPASVNDSTLCALIRAAGEDHR